MKMLQKIIVSLALLLGYPVLTTAQFIQGSGAERVGFDRSFQALRYNAVGDLHYEVDDYVQYLPAAAMVGIKALIKAEGYESRSSWGRMLVSDAISVAAMTAVVNGIKYTAGRPRPDGTSHNSFPSGHTATSFMTAAMLHEEYGWRSPWFSFGGYAAASLVGMSRIINNRHWATDVIAGAAIGMASVKFGYWIADLIFKDKYISCDYARPVFGFDPERKYYDIGLYFGYRFFLGHNAVAMADGGRPAAFNGGSVTGIEVSVPVANGGRIKGTAGIAARIGANSYCAGSRMDFNTYDFMAGGYWRKPLVRILEVDTRILAGYFLAGNRRLSGPVGVLDGIALAADAGLAITTGENFKIKAFAAYEVSRFTVQKPFTQSVVLGGAAHFFW